MADDFTNWVVHIDAQIKFTYEHTYADHIHICVQHEEHAYVLANLHTCTIPNTQTLQLHTIYTNESIYPFKAHTKIKQIYHQFMDACFE